MFNSLRKKIAVDSLVYPWNVGLTCKNCAQQFTVTRLKKSCVICHSSYCTSCIERRPDKRLFCKRCIVLTTRPIDREKLFNLKSRDLVDYLSSRHISTTDCLEKEDLVNAVIRSINVPPPVRRSSSGSYPTSPRRTSTAAAPSGSRSQDDLRSSDGIRVSGIDSCSTSSATSPSEPAFVIVEASDCVSPTGAAGTVPAAVAPEQSIPEHVPEEVPPPQEPVRKITLLSSIASEEDLDSLSIRQLKELLAFNRIDFSGCVEREELMQRVRRLWADYCQSRKDIESLNHSELCKICMDAPIECVLLECGHMAACTQCGKQLSECPICRQFVVRCVRIFKA